MTSNAGLKQQGKGSWSATSAAVKRGARDKPNSVVDLLGAELLAGVQVGDVDLLAILADAAAEVTITSQS